MFPFHQSAVSRPNRILFCHLAFTITYHHPPTFSLIVSFPTFFWNRTGGPVGVNVAPISGQDSPVEYSPGSPLAIDFHHVWWLLWRVIYAKRHKWAMFQHPEDMSVFSKNFTTIPLISSKWQAFRWFWLILVQLHSVNIVYTTESRAHKCSGWIYAFTPSQNARGVWEGIFPQ